MVVSLHKGREIIGIIKINGIINDFSTEKWLSAIEDAQKNRRVKAVIIDINSPGGGVTSSLKLYLALKKLRQDKPVVALLESVAASGGYLVACGADKIIAYPSTVTGSIGVISENINVAQAMKKLGLKPFVVKSGKYKDVGSPFREQTEEDKKSLQVVVNSIFDEFVNIVSEGRNLSKKCVLKYADGSIWTGSSAKKTGFVDGIGGVEEAKKLAMKLSGLKKKPPFVCLNKRANFVKRIFEEVVHFSSFLNRIFYPSLYIQVLTRENARL
jgi:protease-4